MRIRIGNQTAFSLSPLIPFEYAVACGFDAFEWFPDKKESGEGWSDREISRETRKFIRDTALAHDIRQSVHAPWPSNPLQSATVELFAEAVQFAKDIAAPLVNVHFSSGNGIAAYAAAVIPFARLLAEAGIMLSIENTPDAGPEAFNALFLNLCEADPLAAANIGMCLDIGHANLHAASRNDYLGYIDRLDPRVRIVHVHMHENYGDFDSHLTIFTGPSGKNPLGIQGVIERLKSRSFAGSIILEGWPKPESLLQYARNRLREMIPEEKEVRSVTGSHCTDPTDKIIETERDLRVTTRAGKEEVGTKKMIIYNLFPLLAGKFSDWEKHFLRAVEMGFNWIFINPIQKTGKSGSIYSIADYFSFNPLLVDKRAAKSPEEQAREMIRGARGLGLRVMVDLVINHCSVDAEIIKSHPEWFAWEATGRVVHPFADENGNKVVWKDLAKFDHRNTRDKEGLFQFYLRIVDFLADLGFRGFRCDAAYQVPRSLWERLIRETRKKYPDALFFAETLGCPPDLTRKTAGAGFDYIFNSSKWWDFNSHWLMEQYALTRDIAPSISFPESHDTVRLCEELNGNTEGLKQRYLFAALFSAGVMMPMGFEFGFRRRLHVVKTRPEDWEETGIDLTGFISEVNRIKTEHIIFQEDPPAEILHNANHNVLVIWKASTHSPEECLIILNKDVYHIQHFSTESLQKFLQAGAPLIDISPEGQMGFIPAPFSYDLRPGQGIVFITSRDYPPED
jgi:starch synthase (maltosyl-transferring)